MDIVYNGIDVSRWQGTIDWEAVKVSGVDFAFIRAGYCSYNGGVTKDARFDANMAGAAAAGIPVGVYLYSYATTPQAAKVAAQEVLKLIQGYRLDYPVAFDLEDAVNLAMNRETNTAIVLEFLNVIEDAGYCPLLYTYKAFAESALNMGELADYDFWLAHITSQTSYAGPYTLWQYSWTGSVDGISGDVDLNRCYKDYPAFIRENGLNGYTPEEEEEEEGGQEGAEEGGDNGTVSPEEPRDITYVVVKNDTLTHIAKRYEIPLKMLIQANPQIKNPDIIYVGQVINIPSKNQV